MHTVAKRFSLVFAAAVVAAWIAPAELRAQELERAFIFGSRDLACETPNEAGTLYEVVLHGSDPLSVAYPDPDIELAAGLEYPDPDRTFGYEIQYQDPDMSVVADPDLPFDPGYGGLGEFVIYGPFDNSVNNRNAFGDNCPEEIYDSFIGAKNFLIDCGVVPPFDPVPDPVICPPEGIIFRVDVPNGFYRFVAAVGSSTNEHTSRIIVENGGSGPPEELSEDHVVLIQNFDQGIHGAGVFARTGFGCFLPPQANIGGFVNFDDEGFETDGAPLSPTLEVTEGYIRLHQLKGQGTSDLNGGNMVLLELWRYDTEPPPVLPVPTLTRSVAPSPYQPGDELTVTLEMLDVTTEATLDETVPAGWTITDAGGGNQAGGTITFGPFNADSTFTYTVQSPSGVCGPNQFSATATIDGVDCDVIVSTTPPCDPAGACGLQSSGAPNGQLIIGPIDAGQDTNSSGSCDDLRPDGSDFETCDYLTDADGDVTERNVLVEEGDELLPDFLGASCGAGVGFAPNININPFALDDVLTVWRADANDEGLINYNLDENIGDPLNDYIVYSISYLENTTGECLPVTLEVGSDDAVKVRLNGRLVHVNAVCRGVPGYGDGDMVPVILSPGTNIVLIAVVERGGGTGVRLVVRNPDDGTPLNDGSVLSSCTPPADYPPGSDLQVTRALDPPSITTPGGGDVTVTLSATGVTGATTIEETFPADMEVVDAGGGQVAGNTITFNVDADGDSTYTLRLTGDPAECPFGSGAFSGTATPEGLCGIAIGGEPSLGCITTCPATPESDDAELVEAFIFGSRFLDAEVFNEPGTFYTVVQQTDPISLAYPDLDVQLAPGVFYPEEDRPWGYEILYQDSALITVDDPDLPFPIHSARNGWEIYGPLDDSANNRGEFPDTLPEQIYDSFIGAKEWFDQGPTGEGQTACSAATVGNPDDPCSTVIDPDGIIFRVDVPNGTYKFVAAVGDADNHHAHRIIAEDGGAGPPTELGPNHVVLVHNHDQAQHDIGQTMTEPGTGDGVYARVGFGDKIPPPGDGVAPEPVFVDMDEDGMETAGCPESPTLEVTEGYIRIHQLQGNSNDGPGGARDPNGGDMVVLEIWRVGEEPPPPEAFIRGDIDGDGLLNITDAIVFLGWRFLGDPPPPCLDAADVDDRGDHNITDAIFLLQFQFLGTAPPPDPGPTPGQPLSAGNCGTDPTDDGFDCAEPPALCGG